MTGEPLSPAAAAWVAQVVADGPQTAAYAALAAAAGAAWDRCRSHDDGPHKALYRRTFADLCRIIDTDTEPTDPTDQTDPTPPAASARWFIY